MVFCATCNEHLLRRHEKNRCQRWHSAVSCCCYRALPQAATPCCCHCCHCLIRGSSGGAGLAACSGGSGGDSGAILFLVVVIILLLFARPPRWHRPSPFRRPLLFPQAAARLPSCAIVGCCLLLSTALFVVACHSAIVDYCVAGHRPQVHLVALVSPGAGAFVALRFRRGRRCRRRRRCGRRRWPVGGQKAVAEDQLSSASGRCRCCCLGGKARWWPDEAVRRGAAHPAMRVVGPGCRRAVASSVLLFAVGIR